MKTQVTDKSKGVATALKGLRDMMKINTELCNNDKIALQISPRGIETQGDEKIKQLLEPK